MKFLGQFIHRSDALGQIRLTARQLEQLTERVRSVLPADGAPHVSGCALRPGIIVVFTTSAAWASQLRYSQQAILDACCRLPGTEIQRVHFKVLPVEPVTGKHPGPTLTENSRRLLQQAANGISDDELAAALRRLSDSCNNQDAD